VGKPWENTLETIMGQEWKRNDPTDIQKLQGLIEMN